MPSGLEIFIISEIDFVLLKLYVRTQKNTFWLLKISQSYLKNKEKIVKHKFLSSAVIGATTGLLMSSLGFVFAAPARADFYLCNRATTKYLAAVSWQGHQGIMSTGWIQLQPGQCSSSIISGSVANADIGVYGQNTGGGFTTGSNQRCVIQFPTLRSWTISGAEQRSRCTGKGRVMVGFNVVRPAGSDFIYELFD